MTAFTVYTALTAERLNPSYFKRLSPYKPGVVCIATGRAMPALESDYSFIVVRRHHREPRMSMQTQAGHKRYWRQHYVVVRRDYVVATIKWDGGAVLELSNHATRKQADKAMRTAHKARATAHQTVSHSDTV